MGCFLGCTKSILERIKFKRTKSNSARVYFDIGKISEYQGQDIEEPLWNIVDQKISFC